MAGIAEMDVMPSATASRAHIPSCNAAPKRLAGENPFAQDAPIGTDIGSPPD